MKQFTFGAESFEENGENKLQSSSFGEREENKLPSRGSPRINRSTVVLARTQIGQSAQPFGAPAVGSPTTTLVELRDASPTAVNRIVNTGVASQSVSSGRPQLPIGVGVSSASQPTTILAPGVSIVAPGTRGIMSPAAELRAPRSFAKRRSSV